MEKGTVCLSYSEAKDVLVMGLGPLVVPLCCKTFSVLGDGTAAHDDTISTVDFSTDGGMVVSGGEDKTLKVWNASSWTLEYTRKCAKKVTSATFDEKKKLVLYSEKNGDMFGCPIGSSEDDECEYLLGHFSVITDSVLPASKDYIISADRDEKIRVTRYPQTHEIQSFCFGHLDSVTRLLVLEGAAGHLLVSGGMDGTVRLWNYVKGELLDSQYVSGEMTEAAADAGEEQNPPGVLQLCYNALSKDVAVIMTRSPSIFLYSVSVNNTLANRREITLSSEDPATAAAFDKHGRLLLHTSKTGLRVLKADGNGSYSDQSASVDGLAAANSAISKRLSGLGELSRWQNPMDFLQTHRKVKGKGKDWVPEGTSQETENPTKKAKKAQ